MGFDPDTLNIISLNSSGPGHRQLSQNGRSDYLSRVIEGERPDLCLLPGDTDDIKKAVVMGYEQFLTETDKQTVLLYDFEKLQLTLPEPSLNSLGDFPGIYLGQMVCPKAEVMSPKPLASVVKEFSIVTWNYKMCRSGNVSRETQVENIVRMSQRLAMTRGIPSLIGGDFNIDRKSLIDIVKKMSKDRQEQVMMGVQDGFSDMGYLPSMTNGTMSPIFQLVKMNVHSCCSQPPIKNMHADYFVASKALDLQQATFLDFQSFTGRKVNLQSKLKEEMSTTDTQTQHRTAMNGYESTHPGLHEYRPTQTKMQLPARPPKHHGG